MRDSKELLHQLDGFQRELESVLEQVTRMEQAKLKQEEALSSFLPVSEAFNPEASSGHSSHAGPRSPSPEQVMRALLLEAISRCAEIRGLLISGTQSPRPRPGMPPCGSKPLLAAVNAINFDDILRQKQLLQESYTERDISILAKAVEQCYRFYQELLDVIKEYDFMERQLTEACPPPSYSFFIPGVVGCVLGGPFAAACPPPPPPPRASQPPSYSVSGHSAADTGTQREPEAQKPEPLTDDVQFRAVAPASLRRDSYAMLKVMMYRGDDYEQADREARRIAKEIKEDASGIFSVQRYQKLTIRIQSADVQIEEDTQELVWNGRYTCCGFEIFLPADFPKKQVRIKGRVYQGFTVLTDLRLILDVEGAPEQAVPMERCQLKSAFVSYASQDRSRVVACIRGIQLVRPDMDLFFDAVSLRRGERYEARILHEIESRDLFYLFWSRHASLSQWVNKELEHALKSKGADCIEPVPLEPPDVCPPPRALNDRHFNDWILRYELEQRREQPPAFAGYVLRSADGYEIAIPEQGGIVGRVQLGAGYLSSFRTVSGAHLYIIPQPDGGVFIEDLGSTNGTFLNGQRIHGPVCAAAGSRVTLANVDFSLLKRE